MSDTSSNAPTSPSRRWRRGRLFVRLTALATAVVLTVPLVPWSGGMAIPAMFSPVVDLALAIASGTFALTFLLGLPILVMALIRPRMFCRWLCPMGLLIDAAGLPLGDLGPSIQRRVPRIGRLLIVLIAAGSLVGYPLFLWLDPLVQFSALCHIGRGWWMAVFPLIVLDVSILLPKLWCTKLCPLGAAQELVRLPLGRKKSEKASVGENEPPARPRTTRRTVLAGMIGLLGGGIGLLLGRHWSAAAASEKSRKLRPPGTIPEPDLSSRCLRCGNCAAACPSNIIHADFTLLTPLALGMPIVKIDTDYCREDCVACGQVCPSGAIRPFSLEEKPTCRIGLAVLEEGLCKLYFGKECSICGRACPYDAVAFVWSDETYQRVVRIDPERCNGCGACVPVCPGTNYWEYELDPSIPVRRALSVHAGE